MHHRQQSAQQHDIGHQHQVGDQAEDLVVQRHEDEHAGHADLEREDALVDVLPPEAGTDGALLDDVHPGGQRPGAQQQRQVARLTGGEAGDAELIAEDGLDGRVVDDLLVGDFAADFLPVDFGGLTMLLDQHSRHVPADVGAGRLEHLIAGPCIQLDVHFWPFLALRRRRAGQLVAGRYDLALQQKRHADPRVGIQLRTQRHVT